MIPKQLRGPATRILAALFLASLAVRTDAAPAAGTTTHATTAAKPAPATTAANSAHPTTAGKSSPAATAGTPSTDSGPRDLTLKGDQEGTVFHSLTVEGDDRIHVDFDRPELALDLDPMTAPGLEWGSARDVLDRTTPDLAGPLVATSAKEECPYLGRPWLSEFAIGPVARFRPDVRDVERWKLVVVDAKGQSVATFAGKGNPPREIEWDGRSTSGAAVSPGLTYSYVFEAYDRAGNKRNFVGQGFSVPAYRFDGPDGPTLLVAARGLDLGATTNPAGPDRAAGTAPAPILLEAASWLNQSELVTRPIQVSATARTYEQASQLAHSVASTLAPLVIDGPARLRAIALAQPDAPEGGSLTIGPAR